MAIPARFLLQKNFNTHLPDLLPHPLDVAFKILSVEVLKTNEKATSKGIRIKENGKTIRVNMSVSLLKVEKGENNILMVTFKEDKRRNGAADEPVFDKKIYLDHYTLNLEDELKELKSKLHSTYEQLDAFQRKYAIF